MDFYYPGKGKSGDLPPRKNFAPKWHEKILELMPNIELIILVGKYAQDYYLHKNKKSNLTETVFHYEEYGPLYFPIVHPSPLNFRWQNKNPWFLENVVPKLKIRVSEILDK
jgi:Uracil-DNA glycosylase